MGVMSQEPENRSPETDEATSERSEPQRQVSSGNEGGGQFAVSGGERAAPSALHEPVSSIWPMVLAGAIAFTAFGLVTSIAISIVAIVVMIIAIVGWAGELLNE